MMTSLILLLAPSSSVNHIEHRVSKMDTLAGIAIKYGVKVPFFSDDEETPSTPKTDALFIPRENPRALVIRPMDQWPTRSGAEKQSPLKDTDVPVHQDGAATMNVRNKDEVVSRIEAAVASKQFGQEDILCPLIVDACIQVCPKNPVNFNVDNVRVVKLLGGGLHNCSIVRGMVLKTDAVGSIKQVENAKVDVACGRIGAAYFRFKYLDDGIYEAVEISW